MSSRTRLRTGLERLVRGWAYTRRCPPPFRHLRLRVSPDAALSYLRPGPAAFDGALLRLAAELGATLDATDLAVDVGANVGAFGFPLAAASGSRVVAVEPDPFLADLLRRSTTLNPTLRVEAVEAALTDRTGPVVLDVAGRGRAANAIAGAAPRSQRGPVRSRRAVPGLTLDALVAERGAPRLVKIDVEGAEALVLAGAAHTLQHYRPLVVLEVGRRLRPRVSRMLHGVDYVLFEAFADGRRTPLAGCVYNTLALPAETLERLRGPLRLADGAPRPPLPHPSTPRRTNDR